LTGTFLGPIFIPVSTPHIASVQLGSPVLCFGEVLWDVLPRGNFLGGAPLNVAYHLTQLGCPNTFVSAVGADALGRDALAAMKAAGIEIAAVSTHTTLPTGTAHVQLDAQGGATFQISQPVAWDEIPVDAVLRSPLPAAIVFGSLALRSHANRRALTRLLDAASDAWIVCDLNLRAPFDDLVPLAPLLARAHLLKLNADEARRLCRRSACATDWFAMSAELSAHHRGADIAITLGGEGAGFRTGGTWCHVAAPTVVVRDTIGAGDSFTAALIAGRLRAMSASQTPDWSRILRAACALGAFVASQDGAQPLHRDFDLPE
jgi:fructokinase